MHNEFYPVELQPLMQSLLATLADIDFANGCELENVDQGTGTAEAKQRVREKLIEEHRQRREPYVEQIGILEGRIRRVCRG